MSEMDEIGQQTGRFAHSLIQLAQQLAQATTWMDRRRIRRQIRRQTNEELKWQQQLRALELQGTAKAIDTYRRHAADVGVRAVDPDTDALRRDRDRDALVRHYNDLEERILRSGSLTTVEQGIALDGMASATTFPEFELGDLFGKAHRVKGVDALRYRAQVARAQAAAGIERRPAYVRPPSTQRVEPSRYTPQQADTVQDIRRVQQAYRGADAAGRVWLRDRQQQVAAAAKHAGLSEEQITREFNTSADNSRYETQIRYGEPGQFEDRRVKAWHADSGEVADWVARTVPTLDVDPGSTVTAAMWKDGRPQPEFIATGGPHMVIDEVTQWHNTIDHPTTGQAREPRDSGAAAPGRLGVLDAAADQVERSSRLLKEANERNGQLVRRMEMLERGLNAVTADRDDHKQKLDAVQGQVEALRNANTAQAAELKDLRAQSLRLVEVTADRDRYKSERDEAVAKLRAQSKQRDRATARHDSAGRPATGQRPLDTNGATTNGQDELRRAAAAMEQSRAQMHDRIRRDHPERAGELIEKADRQITGMVAAINDPDSVVVRKKMAQLNQQHGPEFSPAHAQDFQQWWTNGGDFKYRLERDRRDAERQRTNTAHTSADTQSTPRDTRNATTGVNGNGQSRPGRDGITRSR